MSTYISATVYYLYPPTLSVVFWASHLSPFCTRSIGIEGSPPKHSYRFIWYSQAFLLLTLFSSIVISILTFQQTIDHIDSSFLHAQIASYIAVLLYFGSGLLPDPDGPYTPSPSNCLTWLVAIVFEVAILIISRENTLQIHDVDIAIGLNGLRIATLMLMVSTFMIQERRIIWKTSRTDIEGDCLIGNGSSGPHYGSTVVPRETSKKSAGWLDYFYGFSRLFPYIWPSDSRKQQLCIVFCFVLLILQRIINILVPQQLGILVDALGVGSMPYKDIALYCLYRGLQGQQGVIGSIRAILWLPISQSLYARLTEATYKHVLLLSLEFHVSKRIGEVMSALGKGGALNTFLDNFAFQLFPIVFDLGIAAVYLFIKFDAFYSIIVVAVMWNYVFVTIYMAKYRAKVRREMAMRDRDMDAAKTDAIMAYDTVHYNGAVGLEISKFRQLVAAFQKSEFSVIFSLNGLNATQNCIFILGVILICLLAAYQISIGLLKVSDFVSLITYFVQLQAPLAFFGSFYNQVQNNLVDAERMLELFNTKPDVVDHPEAKPLSDFSGRVTVSNLTFRYGHGQPALEDVSFDVPPGSSAAIVGESGSGKTTILKLLFLFYNPTGGSICVDGIDTRDIIIDSLRTHIGVVPQDTVLFNNSLMYNLLYAKQDATEEEVFEACRAASIHEKILGFSEGYSTVVGERGLKLSGGEKQRVAIARAILKNPRLMLLDEATASLDTNTEKLIQEALENVTRGRTTITIAHRLSTTTHADQILVLHLGRIVERGTHEDLLAMGGRYSAMWEKQTAVKEKEKEA